MVLACGLASATAKQAVCELFAVVGEDGVNPKCCSFADGGQEGFGGRCRLVLLDINEHPACGPINGNKDIAALVLILHLGQVLHIYMHIARLIRLEGFVLALRLGLYGQSGVASSAQQAIQRRTAHGRLNERSHHRQQVIQRSHSWLRR
ncbi:hypothetical protein AS359_13940 [Comamonas kerstersii]|uniref:Uncharacterized protein n=1 Tax=Comamonas kerstersii TaxID=225992 RepID=A0A0W7YY11_9BURK|nr:hypothetical protein AS359_13940 [Comamonas kerstersii]